MCQDQKYPPYPNFHGFCHHFCHNSLVFIAFLKDSFSHKCHEYPPSLIAASLQPPRLWAGACHLHWQPQLFSIKTYGGDGFRDVMWLKQYQTSPWIIFSAICPRNLLASYPKKVVMLLDLPHDLWS
jgi:hypothetical protein